MSKAIYSVMIVAALGLAACSQKAKNETSEAANAISADANATMAEAARDTSAAADKAFGAAENSMDAAGNKIGNVTRDAKNAAGTISNDIED